MLDVEGEIESAQMMENGITSGKPLVQHVCVSVPSDLPRLRCSKSPLTKHASDLAHAIATGEESIGGAQICGFTARQWLCYDCATVVVARCTSPSMSLLWLGNLGRTVSHVYGSCVDHAGEPSPPRLAGISRALHRVLVAHVKSQSVLQFGLGDALKFFVLSHYISSLTYEVP